MPEGVPLSRPQDERLKILAGFRTLIICGFVICISMSLPDLKNDFQETGGPHSYQLAS